MSTHTLDDGVPAVGLPQDATDWRDYPPSALHPVLAVALRQIVDSGFHATTVRTIARDVGVTVPALYYHFENKQAMLVALLDHAMDIVTAHVAAALAEAGNDPAERLGLVVEAIVLYMANHPDLAFLDSERRALTDENLAHYARRRDSVEQAVREVIAAGTADKAFATPDPEECGRAILTMCQGIAGWYRIGGPVSPEQLAQRYRRIALAVVEYAPLS
ncbi:MULTISPECIES: TetR/AcrR family transcriptional regulator [Bacteria]|uniref:TetR/AcrR family transcriptional regulator n=1 Tax=Bacteria TaxID=2 RepID=UPI003C7EBA32